MLTKKEISDLKEDATALKALYEKASQFWAHANEVGQERPRMKSYTDKLCRNLGIMIEMVPDRLRAIEIATEEAERSIADLAKLVLDNEPEAAGGGDPAPYDLKEFMAQAQSLQNTMPWWWGDHGARRSCHDEYVRLWNE